MQQLLDSCTESYLATSWEILRQNKDLEQRLHHYHPAVGAQPCLLQNPHRGGSSEVGQSSTFWPHQQCSVCNLQVR